MEDDVRELNAASKQLRKLMLDKIGKDSRPATKADLAHFYVNLLLINDLSTAMSDLALADDVTEKLEALKNLRPIVKAMQENFGQAIAHLTKTTTPGSGEESDDEA
ncbi:hypothetical protein ELH06_08365 [Rhizobium ruizarguesonis]|uniref:hypothetical protein n=1 Tax=Rhizobium ruizarguesonis TaxID=2081791 RepID=UPI00102F9BDE|nr:hypothetical protein [Rhizobium ruizarguesonis]TBE49174.1 hypothetical protein ELH06_08365 [Rhizobium ruizarguesonis]